MDPSKRLESLKLSPEMMRAVRYFSITRAREIKAFHDNDILRDYIDIVYSAIMVELLKADPDFRGKIYGREKATYSTEFKFEENLFEKGKKGSVNYKNGVYTFTYQPPKDFIAGKIVAELNEEPAPFGYICVDDMIKTLRNNRQRYHEYKDFIERNQIPKSQRTADSRKN